MGWKDGVIVGQPPQQTSSTPAWAKGEAVVQPPVTDTPSEQGFLTPTEGRSFDWSNVAKSGYTGAALGGGIGAFGGPVGALTGAAVGAVSGLAGGAAGELAKSFGASPAAALGYEVAVGGAAGSIPKLMQTVSVPLHYYARQVTKSGKEAIEAYLPATSKVKGVEAAVKEAELGKPPSLVTVEQTAAQDAVQTQIRQRLEPLGIKVPEGVKASDAMRDTLYKVMDRANANNLQFARSPQFSQLEGELRSLVTRRIIDKKQYNDSIAILKNSLSADANVAANSSKDILNLIQGGSQYLPAAEKNVAIIPKDAANVVRKYFDDYLTKLTNNRYSYDALKAVEQKEFQAAAIDGIPTLQRLGFQNLANKNSQQLLTNIGNAGPEAQKEFSKALYQHFYNVPPAKLLPEFNRISEHLKDTGAISVKTLDDLQKRLDSIPKKITAKHARELAVTFLRYGLVGGAAGEAPHVLPKQQEE